MSAKKTKTSKSGNPFKGGVYVAASLERADHEAVTNRTGRYCVSRVYLDSDGMVKASAGCQQGVIIGKPSELRPLIDFLTKLANPKTA